MIFMKDIIISYLVMMNALGLAVMGIDKKRAISNQWRIPEKTLFLVSAIGGSIGTLLGMYLFRHKTKHWYFVIGMPLILAIHLVVGWLIYTKSLLQMQPYALKIFIQRMILMQQKKLDYLKCLREHFIEFQLTSRIRKLLQSRLII